MHILDVRSKREFEAGHVPGARHVPFWAAFTRARRVIRSPDAPVTVYCGHGPRAWIAKALLRTAGYTHVRLLKGHMRAWIKSGQRVER